MTVEYMQLIYCAWFSFVITSNLILNRHALLGTLSADKIFGEYESLRSVISFQNRLAVTLEYTRKCDNPCFFIIDLRIEYGCDVFTLLVSLNKAVP